MTIKQLLYSMLIATVVCWTIWLAVLFQINPETSGPVGFLLFYFSLFFSLLGAFFLASFGFRKIFNKFTLEYKIVGTSFRQSISFALLVVIILFLQEHSLLVWWNVILLVLALTVLEGFFVSARKQY